MSIIEDGTGTGLMAKVGIQNRLHTHSLSTEASSVATICADAFNINTGLVTLTSCCESALLYIKNNEVNPIAVTTEFINLGSSLDACCAIISLKGTLKFYLSSTTGTLISDASCAQVLNRLVGDSSLLVADVYKGSEGKTLTGQGSTILVYLPSTAVLTLVSFDTVVVLPKGASIGLSWTPPSGMTSVKIIAAIEVTLNGTQL